MSSDMFIRPLDLQTVKEIATEFPAFEQVDGINFQSINGIGYGCFSAQISYANATMCYLEYGWCVVIEPDVILPQIKLNPSCEYLVNLIELDLDTDNISVWECNSGTGTANQMGCYAFDKWNTSGTKSICSFVILIPRLENNRKNMIGVAVKKVNREIIIEFKRDGKIRPKLN